MRNHQKIALSVVLVPVVVVLSLAGSAGQTSNGGTNPVYASGTTNHDARAERVMIDDPGAKTGMRLVPGRPDHGEIEKLNKTTEDAMKAGVLGLFKEGDTLDELRGAINGPWTEQSLQLVYDRVNRVLPKTNEAYGVRMGALPSLLAYVSKHHSDDKKVAIKARELFDTMYSAYLDHRGEVVKGFGFTIDRALRDYGDSLLVLIPSVWKAMEQSSVGPLVAVELHGNDEALQRLVALSAKLGDNDRDFMCRSINMSMLVIYERLKHSDDPLLLDAGRHSRRFEHAQDLWYEESHVGWKPETLREKIKQEFPQKK